MCGIDSQKTLLTQTNEKILDCFTLNVFADDKMNFVHILRFLWQDRNCQKMLKALLKLHLIKCLESIYHNLINVPGCVPCKSDEITDRALFFMANLPRFIPFRSIHVFSSIYRASFLKTLWEKEKLLVTSNFSFSYSVFYAFGQLSAIFIKFKIVACKVSV